MLCGSISTRHGTPNFTVRILSNWQSPKNDVPFGHFQTKNSWKSWVESLVCFAFDVQMCTHESGSACVPTLFDFCRDGRFTGHVSALVQAEGKRGLVSTIWLVIAWIYSFRPDLIGKLLSWFLGGKVIIVFQLVRETDQLIKFPRYVKNVNNKTAGDFIRVSPVAGWFDTFTRHSS
jgi:hypothetical protein